LNPNNLNLHTLHAAYASLHPAVGGHGLQIKHLDPNKCLADTDSAAWARRLGKPPGTRSRAGETPDGTGEVDFTLLKASPTPGPASRAAAAAYSATLNSANALRTCS
jgi:hypothetical protein